MWLAAIEKKEDSILKLNPLFCFKNITRLFLIQLRFRSSIRRNVIFLFQNITVIMILTFSGKIYNINYHNGRYDNCL